MPYTLRGLLDLQARADGASFSVTELFHRSGTYRLSYAALDAGGWINRHEVLVSLDRFESPRQEEWPVTMDRESVEQAPRWEHAPSEASALPPIVVGPFGSTFSPLLLDAQLREMAEGAEAPTRVPGDDKGRIREMDRASLWLGREAFGPDGRLGTIKDIRVSDDLTMFEAILDDGTELPLKRLRLVDEQGHAVFD